MSELTSEQKQMYKIIELTRRFNIKIPKNIYDVGLGRIEDIYEMLEIFNPESIRAFEPNLLNPLAGKIPNNCSIYRLAVCDKDGEVEFYAGEKTTLLQGSIYAPTPDATCINKDPFSVITIPCTRLDTFIETRNEPVPDLLWIDAQGAEYDIISGLGKYLTNVSIIHAELFLKEEYKGIKLLDEVDLLQKDNFELVDGNPYGGVFDNYIYVNRRFL